MCNHNALRSTIHYDVLDIIYDTEAVVHMGIFTRHIMISYHTIVCRMILLHSEYYVLYDTSWIQSWNKSLV